MPQYNSEEPRAFSEEEGGGGGEGTLSSIPEYWRFPRRHGWKQASLSLLNIYPKQSPSYLIKL